jgi:hypothetical protein
MDLYFRLLQAASICHIIKPKEASEIAMIAEPKPKK